MYIFVINPYGNKMDFNRFFKEIKLGVSVTPILTIARETGISEAGLHRNFTALSVTPTINTFSKLLTYLNWQVEIKNYLTGYSVKGSDIEALVRKAFNDAGTINYRNYPDLNRMGAIRKFMKGTRSLSPVVLFQVLRLFNFKLVLVKS